MTSRFRVKEVTEEVFDSRLEVSLKDAMEINKAYEIGDEISFEVTPRDFGRIAAQTAKQVIMQRVREAERANVYDEYSKYEEEIMQGVVERRDNKFVYVSLGKIEAVLGKGDQMPNERYEAHDHVKVFVTKVENSAKGPQVFVSRTAPGLVKRLFEQEVPEIFDGTVEIVGIAREAGDRTKIAVRSTNEDVDAVGTTVGPRGARVQAVVNELSGENIDVVQWEEDAADYIANALNPAQVIAVQFNDENNERSATVIVPDYQLSLAIGRRAKTHGSPLSSPVSRLTSSLNLKWNSSMMKNSPKRTRHWLMKPTPQRPQLPMMTQPQQIRLQMTILRTSLKNNS